MADKKQTELDRMLDTALAKYLTTEPRPGLEDRVLANLRAERTRIPVHAWWRWSVVAVLAVVFVAVALAWRLGKSSLPLVADHSTALTQGTQEPAKQIVSHRERGGVRSADPGPARNKTGHHSHPPVEIALHPKLDQFPSPQPLSEQEIALARYAHLFPQEATLVALAQVEYEKEIQQQMTDTRPEAGLSDSYQQER
jgi:hypothetical protein